jgi:hypothetical protein
VLFGILSGIACVNHTIFAYSLLGICSAKMVPPT